MQLAEYLHPLNRESARHLTGEFVLYPVEVVKQLLFNPIISSNITGPLLVALKDYLQEALRVNSLIENAKLAIGAGQHLGSVGMPGVTAELLRKAFDTNATIGSFVTKVREVLPGKPRANFMARIISKFL